MEAAAETGGLRLKRLDKKAERREVAAHVRALEEALQAEAAPAAALSLAVPLLAARVRCVWLDAAQQFGWNKRNK